MSEYYYRLHIISIHFSAAAAARQEANYFITLDRFKPSAHALTAAAAAFEFYIHFAAAVATEWVYSHSFFKGVKAAKTGWFSE